MRAGLTQALDLAMKMFGALIFLFASSTFAGSGIVPVTVGQSGPEFDACPSLGLVTVTSTLRSGPGTNFDRVMSLDAQSRFYICGESKSGRWTAIVLSQDGILDCRAASPVPKQQPYAGPCVSGWVPSRYVKVIAG